MLDLAAYFERIGYAGPRGPTLETLCALQLKHPLAIPFENLDTLSGRGVLLDRESLERKLVRGRRGGYCFEQNLLLKHVLAALGFDVAALAARVVWERPANEPRPRSHMVLLVSCGGRRYVCDVGFGGLTPTAPIELAAGVEQQTPHETFHVVDLGDGREFAVEARVRGEWKRLYRFDLQEQQDIDIDVLNHYVMSHPDSPFHSRLMAARVAADRRFGLANGELRVHRLDGTSEQRRIGSAAELRAVLEQTFGIAVPDTEDTRAALERVLAAA
jgi:N-hydroxyarylamine O-acetyltransferase